METILNNPESIAYLTLAINAVTQFIKKKFLPSIDARILNGGACFIVSCVFLLFNGVGGQEMIVSGVSTATMLYGSTTALYKLNKSSKKKEI